MEGEGRAYKYDWQRGRLRSQEKGRKEIRRERKCPGREGKKRRSIRRNKKGEENRG